MKKIYKLKMSRRQMLFIQAALLPTASEMLSGGMRDLTRTAKKEMQEILDVFRFRNSKDKKCVEFKAFI